MSRLGLTAAVAAVVGLSLTGCSSALSSNDASEQTQSLSFQSDPPGAEIRTTEGQTCVTPCDLTVPTREQTVTIAKDDYMPQTVQVALGPQPDHSFWQNPPPTLVPNPVHVALAPLPKPKPAHHAGGRKPGAKTRTARRAKTKPAPGAAAGAFPPAAQQPAPAPPGSQ